ncbi:unnamed protein product [Closterium sp. NIES-53]
MAAQELRWLTYLLTDLGEAPRSPPVLYVDNKAMLALCREHRLEHRTNHIALCYFLACELQQRGQLRLAYVVFEANTADIFTKALQPCDHQCFCTMLACFALLDCACVAKNRALTHVGADKWVPYVEWIGRKPKVDMLRVFGCMCMALVPKHLRHNKLGAKVIWAVHLGMAQNSMGWLLWDPFTKKFLVRRDCKFMENLIYKDWKAENEAKIGMRFGEVKSSGLEHVELPLELSSGSTTTRQSSLVNGGEEAKDAEVEEDEVQQVSERAPTLPSHTTSAPRIRVTSQQRQGLHVPAAEEEGRGKRRIQAPNRLTYDALGKPAKSALAGAALIVGDDEESDY